MSIYDELGVRTVVNAATTMTVVGGSLMPDEVLEAMRSAAGGYVDMHELQAAAGSRLASLTRNEAAFVTSSCTAALMLGALGAITGGDAAAIARMPDGTGLRTEIVIDVDHRLPYVRSIELAGGRIVPIGGSGRRTSVSELEAAISGQTALVVWVAGSHLPPTALDLETVVRVAHARGVPVLVDAAAQLPPASNLWHFTVELGADAVAFSGGKGLRGPQASGLLVGTAEFVESVRANASPHERLGRAMKVGKEEIAGLVRAVELYLSADHEGQARAWTAVVAGWERQLGRIPGFRVESVATNEAGQPIPRLRIEIDESTLGISAAELRRRLWNRDPRILVLPAGKDSFFVTPDTLSEDEAAALPAWILAAVNDAGVGAGVAAVAPPLDG
jgi:L-seryl-tRNA(Ser) seleniumtransferase